MAAHTAMLWLLALVANSALAAPAPPPSPGMADNWAVIAAGSKSFMNYRHQADVCHAYQIMIKSGIAADHIILMMQDDVAFSDANPFKGKLYNKKGSTTDVYAGCKIDYSGNKVTKDLFLKVITGDESAGGKVLKSGPNDRVFINFVDHGGTGIIAFPNGPLLHVTELSAALKTMQTKKLFKELVFYMEACESGSMFPDLAADSKIFAVTAANAKESSWGFYCSPDDLVMGKHMGTCLGDLFSIAWMEDSDRGQLSIESLTTQVQSVTKRVNKSHVETFGDKSFESEVIGHFELGAAMVTDPMPADVPAGAVDSRDIHLQFYQNRYDLATKSAEKAKALTELEHAIADRKADLDVFWAIAKHACNGAGMGCDENLMKSRQEMQHTACHATLVQTVHEACPLRETHSAVGGWNSFNMQFSKVLVNLCELPGTLSKTTAELVQIVTQACAPASAVEVIV